MDVKFKVYYKNEYKNYGNLEIGLKFMQKNNFFLKTFYMPYYFSGPVYLEKEKLTYPLEFSDLKITGGCEFKKQFLKPYIETGLSYYNFSPSVFNYLDAFKYHLAIKMKFNSLKPSIKIYYTDPLHPLSDKNWSNFTLNPGIDLNHGFLNSTIDFEIRIFTTNKPADTLHYKRKDFKIDLFLEYELRFKNFKFFPFFEYEQRFLKNPYEDDLVEILKEYKKFVVGIKCKK